jgi:hypothetical protein
MFHYPFLWYILSHWSKVLWSSLWNCALLQSSKEPAYFKETSAGYGTVLCWLQNYHLLVTKSKQSRYCHVLPSQAQSEPVKNHLTDGTCSGWSSLWKCALLWSSKECAYFKGASVVYCTDLRWLWNCHLLVWELEGLRYWHVLPSEAQSEPVEGHPTGRRCSGHHYGTVPTPVLPSMSTLGNWASPVHPNNVQLLVTVLPSAGYRITICWLRN